MTAPAIRTEEEIEAMRLSGKLAAQILQELVARVAPGVTTHELDRVARARLKKEGAKPAFLGYEGFPAVLCTSVNNVAVHGVPSDRKLRQGDLLGLDFGIVLAGWYSDTAVTVPVGGVGAEARRLIEVTREALKRGIQAARPGNHVGDISVVIQQYVEGEGFEVVRELVGHGVGRALHEPPQVPNFGKAGEGEELKGGMTFAIEPITSLSDQHVRLGQDGFAYETTDGALSAHFEHTVTITKDGPEILTLVQ